MRKQDILQRKKPFKPGMKRRDWLRLFPLLIFLASSVLVLLPAPVNAAPPSAKATSMSSTPFYLHPAKPKTDVTIAPHYSLVLPVSCYHYFYSFKNHFVIIYLFPQTTPQGTGIRAPPIY
jgi:hypothetical protein